MVSSSVLLWVALAVSPAIALPTNFVDNLDLDISEPRSLLRRWTPPNEIWRCRNTAGDIKVDMKLAECVAHATPAINKGTASSYPHIFWNGVDRKSTLPPEYKPFIYRPLKFPNSACNRRGVDLRETPYAFTEKKTGGRVELVPFNIYSKEDKPGRVRVIFDANSKSLCGVIAHEGEDNTPFHLCKSEAQWKADNQGWGDEMGPEGGWRVGLSGGPVPGLDLPPLIRQPIIGEVKGAIRKSPPQRRNLNHDVYAVSLSADHLKRGLEKRADACPMFPKCPKNEATIGRNKECQKCPAGQVPTVTQDKCQQCKAGQKPSADGSKCEADRSAKCPKGEASNGPNGKCQKCPKDQEPTTAGDKCQPACGAGLVVVSGNKCQKCPAEKKPDPTKTKCIDMTQKEKDDEERERRKKEEEERRRKEEEERKKKENELREKKAKRNGKCLAWLSSGTYLMQSGAGADAGGPLTQEEITGLADEWPEGLQYVEGDIEDKNIQYPRAVLGLQTTTDAAGLGGIFVTIGREIAKAFGKGAPKLTKAAAAMKKLDFLKKQRSYTDCLLLVSTSIGGGYLHFDPPGGYPAINLSDRPYLEIYKNEDNRYGGTYVMRTHGDTKWHSDRLLLGTCVNLLNYYDNMASGFNAHGLCCRFYRDHDCKAFMFSATNREHGEFTKDGNDDKRLSLRSSLTNLLILAVMSSYACTLAKDTCNNLPAEV